MAILQQTATTELVVNRNPMEVYAIDIAEDAVMSLASIAIVGHILSATTTIKAIKSLRKPFDSVEEFTATADFLHFVN